MLVASQVELVVKNLPASAGDVRDAGWIPGLGRFPCRRKWQPTPVFLHGESHGERSLAGYSPYVCKELDITEVTQHTHACVNYLVLIIQYIFHSCGNTSLPIQENLIHANIIQMKQVKFFSNCVTAKKTKTSFIHTLFLKNNMKAESLTQIKKNCLLLEI